MRWKRLKCKSELTVAVSGRKNFAMSYCDNQIFLTGGMDNGQNLLSEFRIMLPATGNWLELR